MRRLPTEYVKTRKEYILFKNLIIQNLAVKSLGRYMNIKPDGLDNYTVRAQ